MELLFWIAVGLIIYSYALYPIVLLMMSGIKQAIRDTRYVWRRHERRSNQPETWPSVSIIIAAYNEEQCLQQRIDNLLQLNYPKDKLNIHIGSDGSTDATADILNAVKASHVKAHVFEQNRGKINVLNDLVEIAADSILVMSDANTHFEADVIENLVRHFDSDDIGAVCGELHLVDSESEDNKDGIYWRYEQMLKFHESRLGALLGANGAIYAIAKPLYQALPANTIVDDFMIVMNVSKAGKKVLYEPNAVAYEEVAPSLHEEEKRRVRIGTGNYQAFTRCLWALNPLLGARCFSYISHKVLRWFTPHLMLIALFSNLMLVGHAWYGALLALQVAGYLIAAWGNSRSKQGKSLPGSIAFLTFFVSMNLALLKGFYSFLFKNVQGTWQRTSR
ncbi:glycosyltransferase family 2 protein [Agarivorans sp. MS3-6]|uniref:glycosyltransferase family 2 protein n=1 Tax=Agarivorans sp. TSD2052 TaxID=2937286 RepID=UPI00200CB157|nr:glycosyltransferase family 2 protein [Agarivorans sp. TSD2052]UPW19201.1 glycosyltransferase family 2 protein [Agarivorans sp. TSD2052]